MAAINYRKAISEAIARVMRRDPSVIFFGEDVGAAGGAFKSTVGLLDEFGPVRVRDTPISEQAIVGAALGAAMTGLRPIAEIMFSDFLAVAWDGVANQIAKTRYMSGGQLACPLVIRAHNGGGLGFGAQHSQSVENWAMAIPGLKVVAPSTPADLVGLFAAAVADPDPVIFFEHKGLFDVVGEVPDGDHRVPLGVARKVSSGDDATLIALAAMVRVAEQAAERLASDGVNVDLLDLRTLCPLDWGAIVESVQRTGKVVIVEENPRPCGWGAEVSSLIGQELFWNLDAPIQRVATEAVPLPFAKSLEDAAIPNAAKVIGAVQRLA